MPQRGGGGVILAYRMRMGKWMMGRREKAVGWLRWVARTGGVRGGGDERGRGREGGRGIQGKRETGGGREMVCSVAVGDQKVRGNSRLPTC